jgi:hypothetical protein
VDAHHTLGWRERARLRLGSGWKALLRRAGQPQQRGRAWSWCLKGGRNTHRKDVAVLGRRSGRVQLVGSNGIGRSVGGVEVGDRASRVRRARSVGRGVRVRGKKVWVVRAGRVRAVALATRKLSRQRGALRRAVGRMLAARASSAPRRFVPSEATAAGKASTGGRPLAGTYDARLNAKLIALCMAQAGGTGASTPSVQVR